ncbi:MAG: hypothetical protein ACFE91_00370 [Promethearchaeota archaeon]
MMEKMKLKMTTVLIATLFVIITIVTPVVAARPSHPKRILVIAKGDDGDIAGATTSIIAMIDYDKDSGLPSGAQLVFQTKIYDESGKKIYSIKGKLTDVLNISEGEQFYCDVREVLWINLWSVMGQGMIKTTDTELGIEYRGGSIILPNTEGQYLPVLIRMMVNPKGEYLLEGDPEVHIWPEGGWATAIIIVDGIPTVGVVTYLTKYMEI